MIKNKKILFLGTIYLLSSAILLYAEQNELNNEQDIEYLKIFNESSLSSHKKLTLMHKRSNLAKLGKEKINGLRRNNAQP